MPRSRPGGFDRDSQTFFRTTITDMQKHLTKLKRMDSLAPCVMEAFWALQNAAVANGTIPVKYKKPIAIAIALTNQNPCCIDIHSPRARKAGATGAAGITATRRVGAAVTHSTRALSN